MAIIVKGSYFPGFTEPELDPDLAAFLTKRNYDTPIGGAEIADVFHNAMRGAAIKLEVGAQGFTKLNETADARNQLVAVAARTNCMSAIWWMVELEGLKEGNWRLYAGSWNMRLAVMCLEAPEYHPVPVVWLAQEPELVRPLLALRAV